MFLAFLLSLWLVSYQRLPLCGLLPCFHNHLYAQDRLTSPDGCPDRCVQLLTQCRLGVYKRPGFKTSTLTSTPRPRKPASIGVFPILVNVTQLLSPEMQSKTPPFPSLTSFNVSLSSSPTCVSFSVCYKAGSGGHCHSPELPKYTPSGSPYVHSFPAFRQHLHWYFKHD